MDLHGQLQIRYLWAEEDGTPSDRPGSSSHCFNHFTPQSNPWMSESPYEGIVGFKEISSKPWSSAHAMIDEDALPGISAMTPKSYPRMSRDQAYQILHKFVDAADMSCTGWTPSDASTRTVVLEAPTESPESPHILLTLPTPAGFSTETIPTPLRVPETEIHESEARLGSPNDEASWRPHSPIERMTKVETSLTPSLLPSLISLETEFEVETQSTRAIPRERARSAPPVIKRPSLLRATLSMENIIRPRSIYTYDYHVVAASSGTPSTPTHRSSWIDDVEMGQVGSSITKASKGKGNFSPSRKPAFPLSIMLFILMGNHWPVGTKPVVVQRHLDPVHIDDQVNISFRPCVSLKPPSTPPLLFQRQTRPILIKRVWEYFKVPIVIFFLVLVGIAGTWALNR